MITVKTLVSQHGGVQAVADTFSVSRAAVIKWTNSNQIPPRRVARASEVFGIPAHLIRPDVFPNPHSQRTPTEEARA